MVTVVTGAAGFIGRMLVRELAACGPVVGVDRLPQPHLPGVPTLTADLLDHDEEVRDTLAGADAVYHLAGCPDVRDDRPDAGEWRYRDNVLATAAVLAAVPLRTPLLVTSSSSVYGGTRGRRPCAESDRLRPRGGYARSKAVLEQLCEARRHAGGRALVVRPFTVAGEGQRPGMALSRWIEAARAGRPLRLIGSPGRTRDLTDVRQVVAALRDLAASGADGTVNLGTGVGRTLAEIVDAIARTLGIEVGTEVVPAHRVEVPHTLADTRLLRRLIGWAPQTDLDALVARQAAGETAAAVPVAP
ncbi:MAG: NAD-dependent epimerase/dehydratase family protein [Pseudonocardiaceae bacterium]|nr:NAD-dependent epimerase/dehydratase family protein [Pseudonocardiaceae bacterium]